MRKKKTNIFVYVISFKWLAVIPVLFYKKCISPLLAKRCRFYPSCSTYMLDAVKRHGIFKGVFFGIVRLLRCTPLARGGLDPVPYKKGDYKWLY